MPCYIVTYEINDPQRKLQVVNKLKAYNGQCAIHANAWAVLSPLTSDKIRDEFLPLLQPTDKLFVIRSGTQAAWYNAYSEDHSAWLKKNL